ncbi:MAG: plasmid recombination protein [Lachnospiraceae bacterium]|nr:plasmid recombination protein [Lachnospiraceae bacterium]MCM1238566.1 plasmid recombination protein [Lachnospiraceae bacterium]
MMHLEKIANGAESQILQHDGRDLSHHSNKNIDTKKSHLNYCLTEQDSKTALQRFKDRLNDCSYRKQKNNVRMESIVITAPKNLKAEDTALFFKVAHKALQGLTGGKNNEVGAWVHLDEKPPHMHYDFVPAIEINGVLKLSAKNLMNREKLSILHPTMQRN